MAEGDEDAAGIVLPENARALAGGTLLPGTDGALCLHHPAVEFGSGHKVDDIRHVLWVGKVTLTTPD